MTLAALAVSAEAALTIEADVLVLGVRSTDDGPVLLTEHPSLAPLLADLALIGVTGAQDELRRLPAVSAAHKSIALIGVGATAPTADTLRYAAGSAARQLRGVESLVIALPTETTKDVLAVLEGAVIGAYSFTAFRVASLAGEKLPAASITVATAVKGAADLVERATATGTAVHTVKNLGNTPPSDLYPETFAEQAIELAKGLPVEVTVIGGDDLVSGGYGGLLGVGQGSSRGPRMVKVSYSPAGAETHLALVGKGITFDTGGINLKPPVPMLRMKYDMLGAATVLAVTLAAARLGLKVRVTAWLCLAENMPSGTSGRPEDVLHIRGGKTVENLNTDAEGRLVMADGLVAASEENPDAIIDVATLTGAQVVALGTRYVAAMGEDALVKQLLAAAAEQGETLWPMPLPAELLPLLKSDVADLANVKPGNTAGGMLLAGVFLQEFIGTVGEGENKRRIPWAHLDIAGPGDNNGAGYSYNGKGATGVTVRSLLALAEEFSRP